MTKMDALIIYETLLGPSDGFFGTLLYNEDFDEGVCARLQLVYDTRFMKKPRWEYVDFTNTFGNAKEHITLERAEIYGWLKARFPNKDWRKFIAEKVKAEVLDLFEV